MAQVTPVYFDSALIAKFYLNEPGRDGIRKLARQKGTVASSGIAVAEVAAAFHRKLREDAVEKETFDALEGQFEHDLEQGLWQMIAPTDDLLTQVHDLYQDLDRTVYLRAMDALHLITARAGKFSAIYSNDIHLLAASSHVGLQGINPLDGRQSE